MSTRFGICCCAALLAAGVSAFMPALPVIPSGEYSVSDYGAAPGSGEETWCIEFPRVDEDMRFRIGAPALPLVAPAKGAALVQKGTGK